MAEAGFRLLADLDGSYTEHRQCGALEAGVDALRLDRLPVRASMARWVNEGDALASSD